MDHRRRLSLALGVVLILLGAWFIVANQVPQLQAWLSWPWIIIGVGVFLLLMAIIGPTPGLAVPACIVGGIGGLLLYHDTTGQWEDWAFTWTLIPGFVGAGDIVSGLLGGRFRQGVREGSGLIFVSLVLFTIFGAFFGAMGFLGDYWPALLIGLGVLLLIRSLFRFR